MNERVREAFAQHYKAERNRSEHCLGDIVKILATATDIETAHGLILDRLIAHYNRAAALK